LKKVVVPEGLIQNDVWRFLLLRLRAVIRNRLMITVLSLFISNINVREHNVD